MGYDIVDDDHKKGRSIRIRIETKVHLRLLYINTYIKKEDPLE